jgi:D-alanyl-D-alanine dipeptidase
MNVQRSFWDGYTEHLKKKFPTWSDGDIYRECSKPNAPLDVAPHTTGGAVDLTLADENGVPLNMGTEFNAESIETHNATYTAADNISSEARKNRQMLMSVMSKVGFVNYPTEWWHWSHGDKYWAFQTNQPHAIFGSVELTQKETLLND